MKMCWMGRQNRTFRLWGVYAAEDIPARRKVMEYTGERISRKETKRRSDEQDRVVYLFTLDSYWTLDGAVGGSGAEYFNHSCDPNIVAVIRQGHILYLSRRPIQRGEELTFDYHFAKDVPKVPCCCGNTACTKNCWHWSTGNCKPKA